MRKILSMLSMLVLVNGAAGVVTACNEKGDHQAIKHEMKKDNLDTFFAQNNYFSYKGPSFFKDKSKQTEDETITLCKVSGTLFENIISSQLRDKFVNYFAVNPQTYYWFELIGNDKNDLNFFRGLTIGQETNFKFRIDIRKHGSDSRNSFYMSDWLTFSFTETRQYDSKEWINHYKKLIFDKLYDMFSHFSDLYVGSAVIFFEMPFPREETSDFYKKYQTSNNKNVIKEMNDPDNGIMKNFYQFYDDKRLTLTVNSYKYIATVYSKNNTNEIKYIIVNTNITMSYANPQLNGNTQEIFDLNIPFY